MRLFLSTISLLGVLLLAAGCGAGEAGSEDLGSSLPEGLVINVGGVAALKLWTGLLT